VVAFVRATRVVISVPATVVEASAGRKVVVVSIAFVVFRSAVVVGAAVVVEAAVIAAGGGVRVGDAVAVRAAGLVRAVVTEAVAVVIGRDGAA
jgi:hypothetical protein